MSFQLENLFKDGKEVFFERGSIIYKKGDKIGDDAIYYIKDGLVTLRIFKKNGDKIKVYRQRGEIFGIDESIVLKERIVDAIAEENTIVYIWNKSDFFINISINWELSLYSIKSLSSFLRILNSEFLDQKTFSF
ncbi:MAG: cyclic nucleotide-binding domain-containing protein [Exilispira sp.]